MFFCMVFPALERAMKLKQNIVITLNSWNELYFTQTIHIPILLVKFCPQPMRRIEFGINFQKAPLRAF